MLYTSLNDENQITFSKENLKKFAQELELDIAAFSECLDSGKYAELVQQETQLSRQLGVQSTPTFIINEQPVVGAQPYEVFQEVIEQALAKEDSAAP